jgi:acetolactate synthase I/II/III large subunit
MTDPATETAISRALSATTSGVMFGVPGGGNLGLIGACEQEGTRFVLAHTETAAAIMAATHGAIIGAPGATIATRGPGAASLVNGVAHALLDRQALLVLTDALPRADATRIPHQRLDQHALFRPVAKASITAGSGPRAADVIRTASHLANAPAPGPVHIDLVPDGASTPPVPAPAAHTTTGTDQARDMITAARRPVVLLGVGALGATAELRAALADTTCPVLQTYRAKGIIDEHHPQAAGVLTGAVIESGALRDADLVIAVGVDAVELIPGRLASDAPVVSLAAWPTRDRYLDVAVEVVGPLRDVAWLVADATTTNPSAPRDAWQAARSDLLPATTRLAPHTVCEAVRDCAGRDGVITVDAGAHMLLAMILIDAYEPHQVLVSSGLATMGYALPAAIGAWLARPARRVFCLTGDGGLAMVVGELETLVRLAAAVTVVVFNDASLSLIDVKRAATTSDATTRSNPVDHAIVARGYGIDAERVDTATALNDALSRSRRRSGPVLIDAVVDPSTYPAALRVLRGGAAAGRA